MTLRLYTQTGQDHWRWSLHILWQTPQQMSPEPDSLVVAP
jgi:hypothetical protein